MTNQKSIVLRPETLEQVVALAEVFHRSGACGKDCITPSHVIAKMMAGAEMGMAPMESTQSLYIVNGKITIYGVAMSKRIRERGWKIETLEHTTQKCHLKVSKGEESYELAFTLEEVKKAIPKSVAIANAPYDKMYWFTLARLMRFYIPEVLEGTGVQYVYEEMEQEAMEPPKVEVVEKEAVATAGTELPY